MQALDGLEGVELVEDDWVRAETEGREADPDLLYVTHDSGQVTVEALLAKIDEEGFKARVEPNE